MPAATRPRLLWREVTLFDGHDTLPEPMAVIVAGDTIERVVPMRELDPNETADCQPLGQGGVMTPVWSTVTPIWYSAAHGPTNSNAVSRAPATRRSPAAAAASSVPCVPPGKPAKRSCSAWPGRAWKR